MTDDLPSIETEGDAREWLLDNPEKSLKFDDHEEGGWVYMSVEDGDLVITLEWTNGRVELGPTLGDDYPLEPEYELDSIVDPSEIPMPQSAGA